MGILRERLKIREAIFVGLFLATVLIVTDMFVDWDKSIYKGLYAGIVYLVGVVLAKMIFKNRMKDDETPDM